VRKGDGAVYDTRNYTYEALANDVARKELLPLRAAIKARSKFRNKS